MKRKAIVALALLVLFPVAWAAAERLHAIRALPGGLGGWWVAYADNRSHGFGPGANETGFTVVLLTADGADAASRGGVGWLDRQDGGRVEGRWYATPVRADDFWLGREDSAVGRRDAPTIDAVLDRYSFGLDLPEKHRDALDTALNHEGSFYAFGPGGLLVIVAPATRRANVAYAG